MPYSLSGNYNGIELLRGNLNVKRCPHCSHLLDKWNETVESAEKPRVGYSLSRDGFEMASERFRAVCLDSGIMGLTFQKLPSGYYVTQPMRIVAVEQWLEKRKQCPVCGQYEEVLVNGPPKLASASEVIGDMEVVRTDAEYGKLDMKGYHPFFGDGAYEVLRRNRLTGLSFVRLASWAEWRRTCF